jgi:hypothetical protein
VIPARMSCWQPRVAAGCGGDTDSDSHDSDGGSEAGGTSSASGGDEFGGSPVGGGTATTGGSGAEAGASGGAPTGGSQSGGESSEAGGVGGGDGCNETLLWYTVAHVAVGGLGTCGPSDCQIGSAFWGTVTFDSEGRAIDFTGPIPEYEDEWMQEVAGERWPCLANQTVRYCCSSAP